MEIFLKQIFRYRSDGAESENTDLPGEKRHDYSFWGDHPKDELESGQSKNSRVEDTGFRDSVRMQKGDTFV